MHSFLALARSHADPNFRIKKLEAMQKAVEQQVNSSSKGLVYGRVLYEIGGSYRLLERPAEALQYWNMSLAQYDGVVKGAPDPAMQAKGHLRLALLFHDLLSAKVRIIRLCFHIFPTLWS